MRHSLVVPNRWLTGDCGGCPTPPHVTTCTLEPSTAAHRIQATGHLTGVKEWKVLGEQRAALDLSWDSPAPCCTLHSVCFGVLRAWPLGNQCLLGHNTMYVIKTSSSNNLTVIANIVTGGEYRVIVLFLLSPKNHSLALLYEVRTLFPLRTAAQLHLGALPFALRVSVFLANNRNRAASNTWSHTGVTSKWSGITGRGRHASAFCGFLPDKRKLVLWIRIEFCSDIKRGACEQMQGPLSQKKFVSSTG